MLKINRRTVLDHFKQKWARFGAWRKIFVVLLILFLLFWSSVASLFALPVITSVYFMTMIIKNIMDIHSNWKWGNPFACKKDNSCKVIGEVESSEETFIKFPTIDPRTPLPPKKPTKPSSADKTKSTSAKQDDKKSIKTPVANKSSGEKPLLKGVDKKGEEVFDMSSAQKEKLFDPSREDPSKIHFVKPRKLVDDQQEGEKKEKVDLSGKNKDHKAEEVNKHQNQASADKTKNENKKDSKN